MSFYQNQNPNININTQPTQQSDNRLLINIDDSPLPTTRNINRDNINPVSPIHNLTNQMFKRRRN
jgi:hypothetical protein